MLMNNWFECKVRLERVLEGGVRKRVSELWLVNAVNFTDAEARVTRELAPLSAEAPEVLNMKRAGYAEMFTAGANAAHWYKAKLLFVTIDEKGQEKRTPNLMLVQGEDFVDALKRLQEGMRGSMAAYEIHTLQESGITDVLEMQVEVGRTKKTDL